MSASPAFGKSLVLDDGVEVLLVAGEDLTPMTAEGGERMCSGLSIPGESFSGTALELIGADCVEEVALGTV